MGPPPPPALPSSPPPPTSTPSPYPLDVGRVAALATSLYRYGFVTLIAVTAICLVPAYALAAAVAAAFGPRVNEWLAALEIATRSGLAPPPVPDGFNVSMIVLIASGLVTMLAAMLAGAAVIKSIDAIYRGEPISARAAVLHGLARLGPLVGAQLLFIVLVLLVLLTGGSLAVPLLLGAGFGAFLGLVAIVAMVVAVMYLGVRMSLVVPVIVLERVGAIEGLGRSWRLSGGSGWRLFGYLFVVGLVVGLLAVIFATIPSVVLGLRSTIPVHIVTGTLIEGLVTIILAPVASIVIMLLYYDLRWRSGEPAPLPGSGEAAPSPPPRIAPY